MKTIAMNSSRAALAAAALLALLTALGPAWPQSAAPPAAPVPPAAPAPPDLSGTYQCQPHPAPCLWPGASPAIAQSGGKVTIKNDKGETADATLTSATTLAAGGPFNSLGIVRTDGSIDWSNGTTWRRQ